MWISELKTKKHGREDYYLVLLLVSVMLALVSVPSSFDNLTTLLLSVEDHLGGKESLHRRETNERKDRLFGPTNDTGTPADNIQYNASNQSPQNVYNDHFKPNHLMNLQGLLRTKDANNTEMFSVSSPSEDQHSFDEKNDSNIIIAVLFVPLPNNTKHSLDYYNEGLARNCDFFRESGYNRVLAVGDPDYIRSVSSCQWLEYDDKYRYPFEEMKYEREAAVPFENSCRLKINTRKYIGADMNRIWLNKVDILLDLAELHPGKRIVLWDAGLKLQQLSNAQKYLAALPSETIQENTNTIAKNNNNDGMLPQLTARMYPEETKRMKLYNKKQCMGGLFVWACVMSFIMPKRQLGEDDSSVSEIFRKNYASTVSKISREAVIAAQPKGSNNSSSGGGRGCPCYDEEIVLSRLYVDNPTWFRLIEAEML